MRIRTSCPQCDHSAEVPCEYVAKSLTCPKCRAKFRAAIDFSQVAVKLNLKASQHWERLTVKATRPEAFLDVLQKLQIVEESKALVYFPSHYHYRWPDKIAEHKPWISPPIDKVVMFPDEFDPHEWSKRPIGKGDSNCRLVHRTKDLTSAVMFAVCRSELDLSELIANGEQLAEPMSHFKVKWSFCHDSDNYGSTKMIIIRIGPEEFLFDQNPVPN